jgi:uncharacterized membrane protein YfcA
MNEVILLSSLIFIAALLYSSVGHGGVSGLLGHLASVKVLPGAIIWWAPTALIDGLIGSELGSRRLPPLAIRWLLAAVLLVAGLKMLFLNSTTTSAPPRPHPSPPTTPQALLPAHRGEL